MKIGFIGTGNMGGAILKAIAKGCPETDFLLSDPCTEKATEMKESLISIESAGGNPRPGVLLTDNVSLVSEADFIFFAVKPQVLPAVLEGIRDALSERSKKGERFTLVSMAAGTEIQKILSILGKDYSVIRIMPNTPVGISEGTVGYTLKNEGAQDEERFLTLMKEAGTMVHVTEKDIDAVCGLSGCGPAYVYLFLDAMIEEGKAMGLSEEVAKALACGTVRGAAEMVRQTGETPEALRIKVCSPGGATIEGVSVLQNGGLTELVRAAVKAGYDKTLKLK